MKRSFCKLEYTKPFRCKISNFLAWKGDNITRLVSDMHGNGMSFCERILLRQESWVCLAYVPTNKDCHLK